MRRAALIFLAAMLTTPADAAQPEPIDDLQRLFIEDTVALIHPPGAEAGSRAKALMDRANEARARSDFAEMRRALAEARIVLADGVWDDRSAYLASLRLFHPQTVIDADGRLPVAVKQWFKARVPDGSVMLHLGLRPRGQATVIWRRHWSPKRADLTHRLRVESLDLRGGQFKEGPYDLILQVDVAGSPVGRTSVPIDLVTGLERDLADIRKRRAGLKLSRALRASLDWPENLAQTLDDQTRQFTDVDWRKLLDRTKALLAEAEAGHDPLLRVTGLHERHYFSEVSQRIEPYSLHIPEHWDGQAALPLVVLLHGSNGDHRKPFASGKAIDQARARGWAVLAPMGYSPNSGWGNHLPVVLANGTMPEPRPSTIAGKVLPHNGVDPEPAEADVLDALADVQAHYPIDERRIYLAGNSMGGEGTWYLGARHSGLWAAIAPGAGAIDPAQYPYARLGKVPVLAVHGDADPIISFAASADMIARLNQVGGKGDLLRVAGGGHGSFEMVLPQIFDFLAKQERKP